MHSIPGYSKYNITTTGEVYNKHHRRMATHINKYGYERVNLIDDNGQRKAVTVHRLLALTYISNPCNKVCVNHIDGNKSNNCVDNLEWCTYKENTEHAQRTGLMKTVVSKVTSQYSPNKPVKCSNGVTYKSSQEAVNKGAATSCRGIYSVIKGEQRTHNGYEWSRV
jgi:hypothetical protein